MAAIYRFDGPGQRQPVLLSLAGQSHGDIAVQIRGSMGTASAISLPHDEVVRLFQALKLHLQPVTTLHPFPHPGDFDALDF